MIYIMQNCDVNATINEEDINNSYLIVTFTCSSIVLKEIEGLFRRYLGSAGSFGADYRVHFLKGEMEFIHPERLLSSDATYSSILTWNSVSKMAEQQYHALLKDGVDEDIAAQVLPECRCCDGTMYISAKFLKELYSYDCLSQVGKDCLNMFFLLKTRLANLGIDVGDIDISDFGGTRKTGKRIGRISK